MTKITIGTRSADPFTRVPNDTARYDFGKLGPGQVLVYLLSHDEGWQTSEARIAKALGVGTRTVNSSMKLLIEHGFVERSQTRSEGGDFAATTYIVHDTPQCERVFDRDAVSRGRETRERETRERETAPHKKTIPKEDQGEEDERSNPFDVSDETPTDLVLASPSVATKYTEAFDAFWRDYRIGSARPRHVGSKWNAAKQWSKLSAADRRAAHQHVAMYHCDNGFPKHAERYLAHRDFDNFDGMTLAEVEAIEAPKPKGKKQTNIENNLAMIAKVQADARRRSSELDQPSVNELNR